MDDRELLEAKYTAPSGKTFTFFWEVSEKEIILKTGIFTFPDKDGAHVQHQGGGQVSFPMTCIFNGSDHIKTANDFEAALLERETAELQHPVYGIKKVMPTGNIKRKEDCINSLNETIVTVTFTETIIDEAEKLEAVTADELEEKFDEFSEAAAVNFAENITVENISEQLQAQSVLEDQANTLNDHLSGIVSTSGTGAKNKQADFLTSMKELKNNIKTMFNKVETIAINKINTGRLAINIMKLPSRIIIDTTEKIKGYTNLVAQIIIQSKNDPFGINNIKNAFASTRLVLAGAVASIATGSALSIAESSAAGGAMTRGMAYSSSTSIMSRESAAATAAQIQSLLQSVQNYEDTKIEQNKFIDYNATAYLLLMELVHDSIQLILSVSFYLPMRRTIILDRDRNYIELCAELYGSVDNNYLDKFIAENNFNIDEMEIIPMGREVSYYVKSA
jgi:hypothetical protein